MHGNVIGHNSNRATFLSLWSFACTLAKDHSWKGCHRAEATAGGEKAGVTQAMNCAALFSLDTGNGLCCPVQLGHRQWTVLSCSAWTQAMNCAALLNLNAAAWQ
eukprot:scaffold25234_cov21-Tisochrysis_lutea.AAC.2